MVIGRVLVGEGDHDTGIAQMREAMGKLVEAGGELVYCYAVGLLAEAYLKAHDPEEGLAIVAEALKNIETSH